MLALTTTAALAFNGPALRAAAPHASSVNMMAKSKAIPFLEEPVGLSGYVGDKGFDPLGFGRTNIKWMREAELKHGRLAMLAASGFIAVDLGITAPGAPTGLSSVAAHDAAVSNGSMVMLLMLCSLFETVSFFAVMQMLSGETERAPGDFGFGTKFMEKDPQGMQLKEIQNGRLAMVAFGGMVTQAVATGHGFPYF